MVIERLPIVATVALALSMVATTAEARCPIGNVHVYAFLGRPQPPYVPALGAGFGMGLRLVTWGPDRGPEGSVGLDAKSQFFVGPDSRHTVGLRLTVHAGTVDPFFVARLGPDVYTRHGHDPIIQLYGSVGGGILIRGTGVVSFRLEFVGWLYDGVFECRYFECNRFPDMEVSFGAQFALR